MIPYWAPRPKAARARGLTPPDYVLIGRQETLTRPFDLLLKDLEIALKRVANRRDGQGGASKGESG